MVREVEQGQREMREMEERQEREMREMREKHIGEKTQLEKRLKTQEKKQKETLLKLKKTADDLAKKIENQDGPVLANGVEEARGHLECPVCFEKMRPPTRIWQCPQSHLVCETCRDQLENLRCPSCRTETVSQRARVVENMARALFANQ